MIRLRMSWGGGGRRERDGFSDQVGKLGLTPHLERRGGKEMDTLRSILLASSSDLFKQSSNACKGYWE